jgi:two-component system, OmpR family, response regulator MtrA
MPKILIVEDEEVLRETYRIILGTQGYDIEVAPDGEVGLQLCRKQQFDLVLLDLMMPRIDGVGFLKAYQKEGLPPMRIIILSNLSSGDELLKAKSLGAEQNFVKADMSPRQLIEMVSEQLGQSPVTQK